MLALFTILRLSQPYLGRLALSASPSLCNRKTISHKRRRKKRRQTSERLLCNLPSAGPVNAVLYCHVKEPQEQGILT